MKIKVHLCAFRYVDEPVGLREVEVPGDEYRARDTAGRCELAFYYGQNDVTPIPDVRSVSCGDVVELIDGRLFVVATCGFEELKRHTYESFDAALEAHGRKLAISRDY